MIHPTGKATRSIADVHCSWLLPLLAISSLLYPLSAWSQDEDEEVNENSSEQVEESEEAYRRRMELEEAGDRADIILDRSAAPLKAPEGMDALPYDSRKHLRDELRNVIIEQGEWQPEDVNANYPYNPSAAAQKDPDLRKQEEQAWGELIKEYHQREAAALEAGGGRSGGSAAGQGSNAAREQASGNPGSVSKVMRPEADATSSTAGGAGVSQSALEFLKGQAGGQPGGQPGGQAGGQGGGQSGGQAGGQAGAQPGNPASGKSGSQSGAQQQGGSASTAAQSAQQGGEESESESADEAQAQMAEGDPTESSSNEKEESSNPPPPAGSLSIAELTAMEEGQKRKAAENQQAAAQKAQQQKAESEKAGEPDSAAQSAAEQAEKQAEEQAEKKPTSLATDDADEDSGTRTMVLKNESDPSSPPPPPGTIAIPELGKLKGLENEVPPETEEP